MGKKNSSEGENALWFTANTKICPNAKCGVPIEKNQGCNHMKCGTCKFDFCWKCMTEWKGHDSWYNCNKFEKAKKKNANLVKSENAAQHA